MIKKLLQLCFVFISLSSLSGCITGALINLQSGNEQAKHQYVSPAPKVSLPFSWHDGHIIVELTVNNKPNLRFALDSGAAATVLFESSRSKGITLDVSQTLNLNGAEVNIVQGVSLMLAEISIDDLVIVHVPISQSPLFNNMEEAYFDGAIGFDLLNQYVTEIDFEQQIVHFYRPNYQLENKGWKKQSLALHGNIPHVKAELSSSTGHLQKFDWVLDTGAPDYIYYNSKNSEQIDFPRRFFSTEFTNFDGKQLRNTARTEAFQLFGHVFKKVSSHELTKFDDDNAFGLIGAGLLKNFNLRFDYNQRVLWIKKNKMFTTQTLIDRSGVELEPHAQGAVVKSVLNEENLPVRAGDVITKIDNTKLTAANFDLMREVLSSQREFVEICWLSNSQPSCGKLPLIDRL